MASTLSYSPAIAVGEFFQSLSEIDLPRDERHTTLDVLSERLAIPNPHLLMRFLSLVGKAGDQIAEILLQSDIPWRKDDYLEAFNQLDELIKPANLGSNWHASHDKFLKKSTVINVLGGCNAAALMAHQYKIPGTTKEEYTDRIKLLIDEIKTTDHR